MKYKRTRKAWYVFDVKCTAYYSEPLLELVYSDTVSKAKSLFSEYSECEFINIRARRTREKDLYDYNGKELTLKQIETEKHYEKRDIELQSILDDENTVYCYKIKRGYFYRPNNCGYTENRINAGVYEKKEAVSDARIIRELTIKPVDVELHNKLIDAEIRNLSKNKIT